MKYTSWFITRALIFFGVSTLVLGLVFSGGMGAGETIFGFGLAALAIGGIGALVLLVAALVVWVSAADTTFNPNREVDTIDGAETSVIVTHGQRAKTYLLTALLFALVGGSLCLGTLSVGNFSIH